MTTQTRSSPEVTVQVAQQLAVGQAAEVVLATILWDIDNTTRFQEAKPHVQEPYLKKARQIFYATGYQTVANVQALNAGLLRAAGELATRTLTS